MIGMKIRLKLDLHLDRIIKAAERHEKKLLNHIGGYIRKTAVRSMKKGHGKIVSKPGKPPFTWTLVYPASLRYAYDPVTRTVVIGGLLLGKSAVPVPGIIEKGGMQVLVNKRRYQLYVGKYLPRPALRLALKKAMDRAIAAALKDYIKP